MERPVEQLTLRDLFVLIEHQSRELAEHLDLNFLPKLHALDESIHPRHEEQVARDITVRNRAAQVLDSNQFTQELLHKMHSCLNAIDVGLQTRMN